MDGAIVSDHEDLTDELPLYLLNDTGGAIVLTQPDDCCVNERI
jgi:hypothetical protein